MAPWVLSPSTTASDDVHMTSHGWIWADAAHGEVPDAASKIDLDSSSDSDSDSNFNSSSDSDFDSNVDCDVDTDLRMGPLAEQSNNDDDEVPQKSGPHDSNCDSDRPPRNVPCFCGRSFLQCNADRANVVKLASKTNNAKACEEYGLPLTTLKRRQLYEEDSPMG